MLIVRVGVDEVRDVDLIQILHRLERWLRGHHKQSLEMELEPVFCFTPSLSHRPQNSFTAR